jgi:hypothetical protein
MGIEALGYIGVRTKDLGDWASYGTNFLGLQRIDKSRSTLAFRMDDRKRGSRRPARRSRAARGRWPTSAASGI